MKTFIVVHQHRFGADTRIFKAERPVPEAKIVKALHINFEPSRREESLDVHEIDLANIQTIKR